MSRKIRLPEKWREREIENGRRYVDRIVEHARRAEIVTQAVEEPFWREIIEPFLIENGKQALHALIDTVGLDGATWEKEQHAALKFEAFHSYLVNLIGQKDELLEAAATRTEHLDVAQAANTRGTKA